MGNEPNAADATSRPHSTESAAAISYRQYAGESDLPSIMSLVQSELSEPYVIYTYRYFLQQWPHLSFLAFAPDSETAEPVGVIVCKQSKHRDVSNRGYIAMLSVNKSWRKRGIARSLVERSINVMKSKGVEEVVLETEYDNTAALSLYESLGFIREKRLFRFYMNGKDAFRLVLGIPPDHLTKTPSPSLPPTANNTNAGVPSAFSLYSILPSPSRVPSMDSHTLPMSRRHQAIHRVVPAYVSWSVAPFDDDEVSSR